MPRKLVVTSTFAGPASGCGDLAMTFRDPAREASQPDAIGPAADFTKCDENHSPSRPGVAQKSMTLA